MDGFILIGTMLFFGGLSAILSGVNPERFRYLFSLGWEPRDAKELHVARIGAVALGTVFSLIGLIIVLLGIYFRQR